MKMRFLGRTGLQVSELCLGTANFGASGVFEKTGHISQIEADYMVGLCLDTGLNFFNTAQRYSGGISEQFLGKALGNRRQEAIIITKINPARSPGKNNGGLSRKHIIESCDTSLKRLGTDYIDIFQIHEFDEDTSLETALRVLDDLVRQGKVRSIGCSNFTGWQLMKALSISDSSGWERFATLEQKYSLSARMSEYELVPACLDQGVAILAWSPLHGGFLTGKYRRNKPMPTGVRFDSLDDPFFPVNQDQLFDTIEELDLIAKEHNATISQAALNWVLRKPGVCSLIMGMRNAKQLEENLKATEWEMTAEEVARLDKISEPIQDYPYFTFDPEAGTFIKH